MQNDPQNVSRRRLLQSGLAVGTAATILPTQLKAGETKQPGSVPPEDFKAHAKNVKQSVMAWCFNPMPMKQLIPACAAMGLVGMEGLGAEHYSLMKENGLKVALCGSHGFKQGPVNPEYQAMCRKKLIDGIDLAVKWQAPSVITFTGMHEKGIGFEQGTKNCVEFWKSVIDYAEEKEINLVLEHLNSRDDTHPMKGHPGYFGDDVDHCIDMIKQVDSPRMKLLFDVYHVQVMNGDVIRRFRNYHPWVGHVHTAGNPGRGEIDETQEINYPAVIRAIVETGYDGYVAQEYIPTWEDKLAALRHGVALCDI